MLRYYPPAAHHKLGSPWIGPHQVVRQATGHTVGIQKDPEKPIVFVHVDDLKLCPGPQDISWVPGVKSLCASTVAFRPGSRVSDTTPDPSVDMSGWEHMTDLNTSSTVIKDLDRPIDMTGHVLSPFHQRNLNYQDCRFHSIAHLMCYRYAIVNDQRTFATGIRKWSRHLTDFPTPKFTTRDCVQQWHSILVDIYSNLCFKSVLIDTGPWPFTLKCLSPWGHVSADPNIYPCTDIICDVLVYLRVLAAADRLTPISWLKPTDSRRVTRRAVVSVTAR